MPISRSSALLGSLVVTGVLLVGTQALRAYLTLDVGDLFPDFTAQDQDNQAFRLADERGKVVLLDLCTMWCSPCQQLARNHAALVAAVNAEIGADNWRLVSVLLADTGDNPTDQADAQAWRRALGTPARTLHASGAADADIVQLRQSTEIADFPSLVIVDPAGKIAQIELGFTDNAVLADAVVAAWRAAAAPHTQIASLIEQINTAELAGGLSQALLAKLNAAYAVLADTDEANDHRAEPLLRAFIRQVQALAGRQLTSAEADALVTSIGLVLGALGTTSP